MKKFLTVLLALSVVFTYSFSAVGTVFAAADPAEEYMNEQITEMTDTVNSYAGAISYKKNDNTLSALPGTIVADDVVDTNLTGSAIDTVIKKVIADYTQKIKTAKATAIADGWTDTDKAAIDAAWAAINSSDNIESAIFVNGGAYYADLYKAAIDEVVKSANANIAATDFTKYYEGDVDTATTGLKALVAALETEIETATKADKSGYTEAGLGALIADNGALEAAIAGSNAIKTKAETEAALAEYKTSAKEAVAAKAKAYEEDQKADLEKVIDAASSSAVDVTKAQAKLAALATDVAAVTEYYYTLIDAVEAEETTTATTAAAIWAVAKGEVDAKNAVAFTTDNDIWEDTTFYEIVDKLATTETLVEYAKTYAEQKKNEFDRSTGKATYTVATVDAYLAEAIKEIKAKVDTITTRAAVEDLFANMPTATEEADVLEVVKAAAEKLITTNDSSYDDVNNYAKVAAATKAAFIKLDGDYAVGSWDADFAGAIKAIQKEYTKKINAAADDATVIALVKEAQAAMDAVALRTSDATDVKNATLAQMKLLAYVGNTATVDDSTGGTIAQYANSKNTENQYTTDTINAAIESAAKVLYDAVLAQKTKASDLKATQIQTILRNNYAAALAKIDAMQTAAKLDAAAQAIVDAIAALPTIATLENKDAYLAVQAQLESYMEFDGAAISKVTNAPLLDAYMTKIIKDEAKAVENLIKALPKTITVADMEKVAAARAAVEAYIDAYSQYGSSNIFDYGYTDISVLYVNDVDKTGTLNKAEKALSDAKLVDAAKKVAAIPDTLTKADKATVEAARAAYDLLTEEEKADFSEALYDKLVAAEKQLAKVDEDYLKSAIHGTHVKINSSAAKGYIKLSWGQNDNGIVLDGYEVYRSTKKTSGFKKISTFKVQKSKKYTTGLKKGTKYYYYVKGYKMVGDEKVYTHNSITVARTFR